MKLPFPIHSGLQRASKSRHVHSKRVPGRLAGWPVFHHLSMCQSIHVRSIHPVQCFYVVTTGIRLSGMLRQQYETSAVVSARAHGSCCILTGSFTRLILYGMSLLVRTRNALQNELTINGTPAVLRHICLMLFVLFAVATSTGPYSDLRRLRVRQCVTCSQRMRVDRLIELS